jgi:hypothetical protein
MKAFYQKDLDINLQRFLFDAPGVLEDNLFISLLKARELGVNQKVLSQRLNLLQRMLGLQEWSLNLYYTYNGVVAYEIMEVRSTIRKVKKYSGYVRNSSSVGSKRNSGTNKPEPEIFEWTALTEEIDYFQFLTVGRFSSGFLSEEIFFPEDGPKRPKRNKL